jgi:hypothetical protein
MNFRDRRVLQSFPQERVRLFLVVGLFAVGKRHFVPFSTA